MKFLNKIDGAHQITTSDAQQFISKVEKDKLTGIQAGALNNPHPATHPASMITGLPTSLPANGGNANTVGGKSADSFYQNGSVILNTNPFGGSSLYINSLDNALAGAGKKYYTQATIHKKKIGETTYPKPINQGNILLPQWEDSPVVRSENGHNLFDNSYEGGIVVPSDSYAIISIDFNESGTAYFSGYPYGTFYLSYYHTHTPDRAEIRCYNGYDGHGIGYKTLNFINYVGDNTKPNFIQRCTDHGNYMRKNIQIIIYGHSEHQTTITEIDWQLARPNFSQNSPLFTNHNTNKSYQIMNFGDPVANNVSINPNGNVSALNFIGELLGDATTVNKKTVLSNVPINAKFTDTTYTAGQGLSLSSTTFSVAAGNGLNQEASGLALGTPGTITNSTTNSTTSTSHTHELILPAFTWGNLKGI